MMKYEKLSDYLEGRKRYLASKNVEEGVQGNSLSVRSTAVSKEDAELSFNFPFNIAADRMSTQPFKSDRTQGKQHNTLGPAQLARNLENQPVSKNLALTQIAPEELLVPVCICIVSRLPLLRTFKRILSNFNDEKLAQLKYPLEVYVNYLTSSVPYLPRSLCPFTFQVLDLDMIDLIPPAPNELPMCDLLFYPLAESLSAENVVRCVCIILSEHSVVFTSQKVGRPAYVIRTLLSLIFPFEYSLLCVPLLPWKFADVLHSNCPYVVGMSASLYEKVKDSVKTQMWVVDLDRDAITHRKEGGLEANMLKCKPKKDLLELPECEHKKLVSRITSPLSKLKNPKASEKEKEELKEKVRNVFFTFFVNMFKNYNEFVKKSNEYEIDYKKLQKSGKEDYKWFLCVFSNTSICKAWLNAKENLKSLEKACDLLVFDESTITNAVREPLFINSAKVNPR